MNTEEKAKAYDEVLERAREEYEIYKGIKDVYHCEALERIFHKLAESEDEKIRKEIVDFICWATDRGSITSKQREKSNSWLAWLEKQGEHKDTYTKQQLRDMGFAFTLNGDIVTPEKTNEAIKEYLANEKKKWEKEQKPAWSEEDNAILEETLYFINEYQKSNRCKDENGMQNSVTCEKWLQSIKDRVQLQPKLTWSEEDEKKQNYLIALLQNSTMNNPALISVNEGLEDWLKSLKERVQPKQEWSEEDEEKINSICNIIADKRNIQKQGYKSYYNGLISWLKSLRPQKQWKPTEDNIDQAISILEKAAKDIKIPEKYKTSDWLCEKEDDLIENLHRQLRDNILRAKEEAKNKI